MVGDEVAAHVAHRQRLAAAPPLAALGREPQPPQRVERARSWCRRGGRRARPSGGRRAAAESTGWRSSSSATSASAIARCPAGSVSRIASSAGSPVSSATSSAPRARPGRAPSACAGRRSRPGRRPPRAAPTPTRARCRRAGRRRRRSSRAPGSKLRTVKLRQCCSGLPSGKRQPSCGSTSASPSVGQPSVRISPGCSMPGSAKARVVEREARHARRQALGWRSTVATPVWSGNGRVIGAPGRPAAARSPGRG